MLIQKPGWITNVWLPAAEAAWTTDFLGGIFEDAGVESAMTTPSVAAR